MEVFLNGLNFVCAVCTPDGGNPGGIYIYIYIYISDATFTALFMIGVCSLNI
jgi:hypothetical protein